MAFPSELNAVRTRSAVTRLLAASAAPLVVSIVLYVLWYAAFGAWAIVSVADALAGLAASIEP